MATDSTDFGDVPLIDGRWGYIVYSEHYREPFGRDYVTVDRADPWALVQDEILHEVLDPGPPAAKRPRSNCVTLRPPPDSGWCAVEVGVCQYPSHPFCFTGWTMTITTTDRSIVYRLGNYRPHDNTWEATWPD